MSTVAIDFLADERRPPAANTRTISLPPFGWTPDFRAVFLAHYAELAPRLRAVSEPTVAVVAIDVVHHRLLGVMRLAARPGRVAGGIIGRHGSVDLTLLGPDDLSLRHLAVLVEPPRSWRRGSAEVAYRVVDLRTGTGFRDEHGVRLGGVRCEGPAFFHCGPVALLCLCAGDASDWPESAADAWSMIPDRVMFDERAWRACGSSSPPPPVSRSRPPTGRGQPTTRLVPLPAPLALGTGLVSPEGAVGILEVHDDGAVARVPLGEEDLREGILVGRYDRCAGAEVITDDRVSRTHLLIIDVGGRLWALDTGSTNGTTRDGAPVRLVELRDPDTLVLAGSARVVWRRQTGAPSRAAVPGSRARRSRARSSGRRRGPR